MSTTRQSPPAAIWRRYWLDIALVVVAIAINASALIGGASTEQVMTAGGSSFALLIFLGRRWQPLAVSLLAFAVLAIGSTFSLELTPGQFFGILITFCLVGAVNRERDAVIGWSAGVLAIGFVSSRDPHGSLPDFALTASICTIVWAAGLLVSRRSRSVVEAEERARDAERTRALHAENAVAEERARIAAELHDIVSHGLSIVIVQTVAARSTLTDTAGLGGDCPVLERRLAAIEETSREALQDMRRMLGLIQQPALATELGGGAQTAPSPDLRHVASLVTRAESAGLAVDSISIDPDLHVSAGLALTAYRIVQESLTNAIKHAPGSRVTVAVRQVNGQLAIAVTNWSRADRPAASHRIRPGTGRRTSTHQGVRRTLHHATNRRRRLRGVGYAAARQRGRGRHEPRATRASVMIGVLLADDQALIRDGFRALIDREDDMRVVAEAADGAEAVTLARQYQPAVILMDIRMPNLDGLAATRRILDQRPAPKILMLTTFDRDDWIYEALRAGASGFLLKDVRGTQLTDAVRTVAGGEALVAPSITRRFIEEYLAARDVQTPSVPVATLTDREVEVLRLIALGLSNAEIAARLFIGHSTVKTYVNRLLTKLNLRDRTQAVVYAYESRIVVPGRPNHTDS